MPFQGIAASALPGEDIGSVIPAPDLAWGGTVYSFSLPPTVCLDD
jgi:hypothetical protein